MFISQVTFEASNEMEERLQLIMKKKMAHQAPGLLSSECWRTERGDQVGYSLVNKWDKKADFQAWMKASHAEPRQHREKGEVLSPISKTAHQYELIERN